jgi:hypothetical protein
MSPAEFERFVAADLFGAAREAVDDFRVALHERITGLDGSFDFDATVRYRWAGMEFLVVVEAKRHRNPIKRELVQALHSKAQSVGAQKAVMVASAPFQRGARTFATAHGIALVAVTEGRFTYETRSREQPPALSREQAARIGLPTFAAYCFSAGSSPDSTAITAIGAGNPERDAALLLGLPSGAGSDVGTVHLRRERG